MGELMGKNIKKEREREIKENSNFFIIKKIENYKKVTKKRRKITKTIKNNEKSDEENE